MFIRAKDLLDKFDSLKKDPRNEKSDFRYEMQINGRRI